MTVNTTKIIGKVSLPNSTVRGAPRLVFTMTGFDTDDDENTVIIPTPIVTSVSAGGDIDVDLWPNQDGVRATLYNVDLELRNGYTPSSIRLGRISVPVEGGPYVLGNLLPLPPPPGLSIEDYIALLEDAVDRAETAADQVSTLTVDAETLAPGSDATVSYTYVPGETSLIEFGIPRGDPGATTADGVSYRDGDTVEDALDSRAQVYSSRAAFEAATIANNVTAWRVRSGDMLLSYVRVPASTANPAIVSANGVIGMPDGASTPQHWGAVADFNTGTQTGTDDTAAFLAMEAFIFARGTGAKIKLFGRYLVNAPIVFRSFGVEVESDGNRRGSIYGNHTSGPVIQFRKSFYALRGVGVFATDARKAAGYSILNSGVIVGDFDWTDPASGPSSGGAFGVIDQNAISGHPGDAVFVLGGGNKTSQNNIFDNKGHGFRVDPGPAIGVAASSSLGFPGWSKVDYNKIEDNGGHAVCLGSPDVTSANTIYRYQVENNDCNKNATDAAVRFTNHQYYLVGEQIESKLNVANAPTAGFFVAGKQHKHSLNRTVNLAGEVYEVGNLASYSTNGVIIDEFRVNSPTAPLNPAVKVASSITPARAVRVKQGHPANITNIVDPADRQKFAEISYQGDTDFTGTLREKGNRVGPLDEGTFTPTVRFSTPGDSSFTYSMQSGYYKRFGNIAFIQIALTFTSNAYTTAAGVFLIDVPLPFSMLATSEGRTGLDAARISRVVYDSGQIACRFRVNGATALRMTFDVSGDAAADSAPSNIPPSVSNFSIILSGWVRVAT